VRSPQSPVTPITFRGCASPNYIFQGCPLGAQPGNLNTDAERRLESQAIASVLQQYGLPESDGPLVLRYARNEVRAALFAEIEAAFQTQRAQRTDDQQLLVDTYTRLVREKHAQAARAAWNQYAKWQAQPCSYRPPPGFSYSAASACIGLSQVFTPESPGLQAFVEYGVSMAYTGTTEDAAAGYVPPSVADPRASPVFWATSNAALLGYSALATIYAGAVGSAVGAALPASVVQAIFPFAVRATTTAAAGTASAGAAAVGGIVTILVATVSTAIIAGQTLARENAIPSTLQSLVDTAGSYDPEHIIQTCSGPGVVCGSATSTDLRQAVDQELFASFVPTTLPDYPSTDPAPAAQPGDPQLVVAGSPVDWVQYKADDGTQRAFRLSSGPWFADRAGSDGAGTLTLSIKYQDASGGKWVARRVGNQFLIVRTDIPPTRFDYPQPRQSTDLSIVNWSGSTVTAQVGGQVSNVVQVSAGGNATCALKVDGSIVCWGDNSSGQTNVPSGLVATQVSMGGNSACAALKANGSVVCWGDNSSGQTYVPTGLDRITQLSTGSSYSCAVADNGTIFCWGDNSYDQANPPRYRAGEHPAQQVSAGTNHACAVGTAGDVICWGDNRAGQRNVPSSLVATQVSAGGNTTCALKADGSVVCWGDQTAGQTNVPSGLVATQVSVGGNSACAVKRDGSVVCWGDNSAGQTSVPSGLITAMPVSTGSSHSCTVAYAGSVVCWGSNTQGQTSVPSSLSGTSAPTSP
jgi:alpha-tubulin suppressor-like RCC1 family protein